MPSWNTCTSSHQRKHRNCRLSIVESKPKGAPLRSLCLWCTNTILGIPLEIDGTTWTFAFPERRTCKLRLRLQDQKQVEIERFEIYGPSNWKSGDVRIEWGHTDEERTYDGSLSAYNGEVLEAKPFGSAQAQGPFAWTSTAGKRRTAGIVAKVLYTSGMDVDRTIVTLRTKAGDFSFLPGEALEYQPVDIPVFCRSGPHRSNGAAAQPPSRQPLPSLETP